MRILCCVNRDLYSNLALNQLLPALRLGGHALRVVASRTVGRPVGRPVDRARLPAELAILRAIEQDIPNEVLFPLVARARALPHDRALTWTELAVHCDGVAPVVADINSGNGLQILRDLAPDLVVSIRYGHILKAPAIAAPRLGVMNLHSGMLPAYRGMLSTLHAIAQGEQDVGCTLHWIVDAGIDTGPIIALARRPVERDQSLFWHILSLYPLGVPLIVETIRRLTSGEELPRTEQDLARGRYYSAPAKTHFEALERNGVALFQTEDLREAYGRFTGLAQAAVGEAS